MIQELNELPIIIVTLPSSNAKSNTTSSIGLNYRVEA